MKEQLEPLTTQQSLDIITNMILQAKGNVKRNSFYFLLWGWVVFLANVGMFILTKTGYAHPYIVWAITIPAWGISMYKGFRQSRERHTTTHLDKISTGIWIAFGVIVFTLVGFGYQINYQLNPVIITMSAIPAFASGIILRFKPLILGSIIFWIFGIICFIVPRDMQPLIGAAAIVCGYLIPGYMLKNQKN